LSPGILVDIADDATLSVFGIGGVELGEVLARRTEVLHGNPLHVTVNQPAGIRRRAGLRITS